MTRTITRAGWAWTALIGAALWGGGLDPVQGQTAKPIPATRAVAVVNGETITYGQLEPLLRQAASSSPEMHDAQQRDLQREALSLLIDDVLTSRFLRKNVPLPSPREIDQRMAELETALKKDKRSLAQMCKENHQTEAEVRQNLVQMLQWSQYAQKRITDVLLQEYYQACKDFFDRVRVRASHIFIRVTPTSPESERQACRQRLQTVRAQILAGQLDFALAAKQHSQCPSATNGGDIGHFPSKFVVEESFARAAFSMKPGEISEVVQTQFGLHLIKVTGRDPGQTSDFSKIKETVREVYLDELRQTILAQMRKDAKIEVLLP